MAYRMLATWLFWSKSLVIVFNTLQLGVSLSGIFYQQNNGKYSLLAVGGKERNSKAYAAIGRQMLPPNEALLHLRYRKAVRPYLKKPYTRH